ncbi:hypothetical protein BpHYR1_030544 [Brachionus plicatilis]|uniref:Uncharacterized protein n=1 Tax=Brachionus plicatilis TaxID=10195 RepID=A0A3M7SBP1_BRAPC|nr:hypothetical protein BpHYR1_030544 [Brachionus plicatilis]
MNSNLNFDSTATENFRKVNNKFFSISYLSLEQKNISPTLKSFIYKTYCLSKFTYGLGITTPKEETKKLLNTTQNNLIRLMFDTLPPLMNAKNKSFKHDIATLEKYFNKDIMFIKNNINQLKLVLKSELEFNDAMVSLFLDSINWITIYWVTIFSYY